MTITEQEIKRFLDEFKVKMGIWQIIFRNDRAKNMRTFADLEITQTDARKIIERLEVKDYSEGPLDEKLHNIGDMWVFGIFLKSQEVYIKVAMGHKGSSVICISFHVAEHKMNYPFKNIGS